MNNKVMLPILFISALVVVSSSYASTSKAEKLINHIFHGKVKIIRSFKATEKLRGFVIEGKDNKASILYVDKSADYAFLGTLIDKNGKDLTYIAESKYVKTHRKERVIDKIGSETTWFQQGNPKANHQMYVIAEPNCSACHYFYESVKPYIAEGKVSIRWILVPFLKQDSEGKVAAILASNNPAKSWENNEARFNSLSESGGAKPLVSIAPKIRASIQKNLNFMNSNGFRSTPVVIFQNSKKQIAVQKGALPKAYIGKLIDAAIKL